MKKNKLCLLLRSLFRKPRKKTPIIIWFHNAGADSIEALKAALASEIPNHVMIYARHRECFDWEAMPNVLEAIQIVKDSPAKLIWSRCLWPYWDQSNIKPEDFFNPGYYVREIDLLQLEAEQIGADHFAFDTEPYGDSIMKRYLQGTDLTADEWDRLQDTMAIVTRIMGQVDYVYPCGHLRPMQGWNVLAALGEKGISENTYYDNEDILNRIWYEYDIFGAYLNLVKERPGYPTKPYYLVPTLFQMSHRWVDKKGLFLYPRERSALEVAKELLAYSKGR